MKNWNEYGKQYTCLWNASFLLADGVCSRDVDDGRIGQPVLGWHPHHLTFQWNLRPCGWLPCQVWPSCTSLWLQGKMECITLRTLKYFSRGLWMLGKFENYWYQDWKFHIIIPEASDKLVTCVCWQGYASRVQPFSACVVPEGPPKLKNYTGAWIGIVRRNDCPFDEKVLNAQIAGYDAVIVHNIGSNDLCKISPCFQIFIQFYCNSLLQLLISVIFFFYLYK